MGAYLNLPDASLIRVNESELPESYVILTLNHGGETIVPETLMQDLLNMTLPRTGITFEQTGPRRYREVDPA